jgi:hypothetical protein
MRALSLCTALVGLIASQNLAAQTSFGYGATLGAEYDSNAGRRYDGRYVVADGLTRASLDVDVAHASGPHQAALTLSTGAKVFSRLREESTVAARIGGGYRLRLLPGLATGVDFGTRGRHLLGGARDYAMASGDLALVVDRWSPFVIQIESGPNGLKYFPDDQYSFVGAGVGGGARCMFTTQERAAIHYRVDQRLYRSTTGVEFDTRDPWRRLDRRVDTLQTLSLTLVSARAFFWSLGYAYFFNQSSSPGERFSRHRVEVSLGARMPFDLTFSTNIALQTASYGSGFALSRRLLVDDMDENQNKVVVALSRRLTTEIALEARLAFYHNELSYDDMRFSRMTTTMGLSYRP